MVFPTRSPVGGAMLLSGPKDSANSPTVIHRDVSDMRFPFVFVQSSLK